MKSSQLFHYACTELGIHFIGFFPSLFWCFILWWVSDEKLSALSLCLHRTGYSFHRILSIIILMLFTLMGVRWKALSSFIMLAHDWVFTSWDSLIPWFFRLLFRCSFSPASKSQQWLSRRGFMASTHMLKKLQANLERVSHFWIWKQHQLDNAGKKKRERPKWGRLCVWLNYEREKILLPVGCRQLRITEENKTGRSQARSCSPLRLRSSGR